MKTACLLLGTYLLCCIPILASLSPPPVEPEPPFQTITSHAKEITCVSLGRNGDKVLSASEDGTVSIIDLVSDKRRVLKPEHGIVKSAVFSPDGRRIATAGENGVVKIWNSATLELLQSLEGHERYVGALTYSKDGKLLISAGMDETVRVWDTATNKVKMILKHDAWVWCVSLNPDETLLATGGVFTPIRLWDMKTGKEKSRLAEDKEVILSLCFSPDGKTLAGVGWSRSVRIWDLATLRESNSWMAHGSDIYHVSMLPEKRLLTTSSDGWARVWDLRTGEKLHEVKGPKGNHAATVSTDGSVLITGDDGGFVRSWDIPYRSKK